MENVDPRFCLWFSTKKKKNIEFSDSGFPPKNKKKKNFKKKNLKKKKKKWKTWIRESGSRFPQKKKKKKK